MPQSIKAVPKSPAQMPDSEFVFETGPLYAEKDEYIDKGLKFDIHSVVFEPNAGFDGQDRWAIHVAVDDGRAEEIITLQSNERRDEEMRRAQAFIASKGPIRSAHLKRAGKAYYFESESKSSKS